MRLHFSRDTLVITLINKVLLEKLRIRNNQEKITIAPPTPGHKKIDESIMGVIKESVHYRPHVCSETLVGVLIERIVVFERHTIRGGI